MSVRAAGSGDAEAIAGLEALSFPLPWTLDQIRSHLGSPGGEGLVLEEGDVVAGMALVRTAGGEAELLRIAVDPARRRGGRGRLLFERVVALARSRGCRELHLEVRTEATAARALYSSFGLEVVGTRRSYYRDGSDAILYRADLAAGPPRC